MVRFDVTDFEVNVILILLLMMAFSTLDNIYQSPRKSAVHVHCI